mgnify:CR=1 FL=1
MPIPPGCRGRALGGRPAVLSSPLPSISPLKSQIAGSQITNLPLLTHSFRPLSPRERAGVRATRPPSPSPPRSGAGRQPALADPTRSPRPRPLPLPACTDRALDPEYRADIVTFDDGLLGVWEFQRDGDTLRLWSNEPMLAWLPAAAPRPAPGGCRPPPPRRAPGRHRRRDHRHRPSRRPPRSRRRRPVLQRRPDHLHAPSPLTAAASAPPLPPCVERVPRLSRRPGPTQKSRGRAGRALPRSLRSGSYAVRTGSLSGDDGPRARRPRPAAPARPGPGRGSRRAA